MRQAIDSICILYICIIYKVTAEAGLTMQMAH